MITETLCQARQQIQSDDNKRPIGLLDVFRILLVQLELLETSLDDGQAPLVDWQSVWGESRTSSDRHG